MDELPVAAFSEKAQIEEIVLAIMTVEQNVGIDVGPDRRAAMAETLQDRLTTAQLIEAAEQLKTDPDLDSKIRYGKSLTPADFMRVIEGDKSLSKLYNYFEACNLMAKGAEFTAVAVPDREKPMFRRIG